MNKIVLEHYPASKLPEELRTGIDRRASVKVTIEVEKRSTLDRDALLSLMERVRAKEYNTTLDEAVSRVRSLRDEWD